MKNLILWVKEKGFLNDSLPMAEMAEMLGTSAEELRHFFSVCIGMNFGEWRKRLRMEYAKSLLLQMPDSPIEAIGIYVGINDRSNFRKQFLETYRMTPSEWREKNKRRCRRHRRRFPVNNYFLLEELIKNLF